MDSPFEVLGIDPDAGDREIERAYRRRAKETHPDQGGSRAAFRRVRAAYEELASRDRAGNGADEPERTGRGERRRDAGDDADDEPPRQAESRVEYLDYEAVADHGWALDDGDLFEKAAAAGLDPDDHGRFLVQPHESLLQAAENRGFAWPYACRGGACANCAVAVTEGEMNLPVDHVLPPELTDRGIRLSCVGGPTTETMRVVYNVKHLPALDELRLPPDRFERERD